MFIRRKPSVLVTPSPSSDSGVVKIRRVERVDSVRGEPHWCFWTTTDMEAITLLVNAFRGRPFKPSEFRVVNTKEVPK